MRMSQEERFARLYSKYKDYLDTIMEKAELTKDKNDNQVIKAYFLDGRVNTYTWMYFWSKASKKEW